MTKSNETFNLNPDVGDLLESLGRKAWRKIKKELNESSKWKPLISQVVGDVKNESLKFLD